MTSRNEDASHDTLFGVSIFLDAATSMCAWDGLSLPVSKFMGHSKNHVTGTSSGLKILLAYPDPTDLNF